MIKPRPKHPRLADRDYEILDHIIRYRLSTREVLHSLFFKESELNAVTKVTSRLAEYGFLNRYNLYSDKTYFALGPAGAKLFGFSPKRCQPAGPQVLIENYAILQYCCMGKTPRERLLVREVEQHLGSLKGKHLRLGLLYIDHEGSYPRLACMRVDHGSDAAHILRRCRAQLENQVAHPKFAELVREQKYMQAIITSEEQKVRDIKDAILRQQWSITFRVEAVPSLTTLLTANIQSRRQTGDAADVL